MVTENNGNAVVDVTGDDQVVEVVQGEVVDTEDFVDPNEAPPVEGEVLSDTEATEDGARAADAGGTSGKAYTNVFARLVNKIASVFPEGNQFRNVFNGMADNLEAALGHHMYESPSNAVKQTFAEGAAAGAGNGVNVGQMVKNGVSKAAAGVGSLGAAAGVAGSRIKDYVQASDESMVNYEDHVGKMNRAVDMADDSMLADYFMSGDTGKLDQVKSVMERGAARMTEVSGARIRDVENTPSEAAVRNGVSGDYVSVFENLKEFDKSMQDKIRAAYTGQERRDALSELGNYMNGFVLPLRESLYDAQRQNGEFLTEQDRQKLDSMSFSGVSDTYSEYEFGKDMEQDTLDMEDDFGSMDFSEDSFAASDSSVGDDRPKQSPSYGNGLPKMSMFDYVRGKGFRTRQDRGAMAEERFGHIGKDTGSELSRQSGMEL